MMLGRTSRTHVEDFRLTSTARYLDLTLSDRLGWRIDGKVAPITVARRVYRPMAGRRYAWRRMPDSAPDCQTHQHDAVMRRYVKPFPVRPEPRVNLGAQSDVRVGA